MSLDLKSLRWLDEKGQPLACTEKLKVLTEALTEFRELAADTLADAVIIGCREADIRQVLRRIVDELEPPYLGRP